MQALTGTDVARMRDQLFFEGPERSRRLSRFWLLLPLSAVIAAAGVISDSTATVIGAMIVAPLMTPIVGTSLAVVLGDRDNLWRSLLLIVSGVLVVIAVGVVLGLAVGHPIVAANNTQVAGRIHPRIIDLVAAIATGAVGAIALARSDISDTLPGVAIAISLVPPLAVVGITLSSGAFGESLGSMLLFVSNVSAILVTGLFVFLLFGARRHELLPELPGTKGVHRGRAGALIAASLLIVAIPLSFTSVRTNRATTTTNAVTSITRSWAHHDGWSLVSVTRTADGRYLVRVTGSEPGPSPSELRSELDAAGFRAVGLAVTLIPSETITLPGR